MKSICRFCLYIFIVLFLFPFSAYTQASGKKFVVVIDAGHGGKDPGAIGRIIREKNINLGIALKLGALIRENHPDVKVVYTRDRDIFVELRPIFLFLYTPILPQIVPLTGQKPIL